MADRRKSFGFIIIARIAQAPEDAFILSIVPKTYAAYTITTVAITVYCTGELRA